MTSLEQHLAAHQLGKRIDNNTLVCQCGDFARPMPGTYDDPYSEHRAHVAATWREARTVSSSEQLDGLSDGSVILWNWGHGLPLTATRDRTREYGWDHGSGFRFADALDRGRATATILWTPEGGLDNQERQA